ncbi:hypothetical protein IWQ60_007258 [Tieghemiomyces parasiticus]|uniref:Uncharacterized protein n=1 Tax=Tieghemiomyces parasiticus TaxID=78921 RepID=A0A9W7ZYQ1_9FUNG|nr:hypothetical protein IWQ60_007258 [Tieghemiomyces parasiticus]
MTVPPTDMMTTGNRPVKDRWEFAFVHGFCTRFASLFKDLRFDPNEFEVALQSQDLDYWNRMIPLFLGHISRAKSLLTQGQRWPAVLPQYLGKVSGKLPWTECDPSIAPDAEFRTLSAEQKLLVIWGLCETLLMYEPAVHKYISSCLGNAKQLVREGFPLAVEPFHMDHQYMYYYFDDDCQWEAFVSSEEEFKTYTAKLAMSTQRHDKIMNRILGQEIKPKIEAASAVSIYVAVRQSPNSLTW